MEPSVFTFQWILTLFTGTNCYEASANVNPKFIATIFNLMAIDGPKAFVKITLCLLNEPLIKSITDS